jgi:SNF2 family DNA or RNA helicase
VKADEPKKPRVFLLRKKLREGPPSLSKIAKLKKDTELQPHQERALKKMKKSDAMLLYHGLGSGKTLSSIAATEGMNTDVVVPASLRPNYRKELKKFTTTPEDRHVMSYEAASKGLHPKDALVVDEAHRLGGQDTVRSQALVKAAPEYKKRILLTGSPLRNQPYELAPLIHILDPKNRDVPLDPDAFTSKFVDEHRIDPGIIDRVIFGMSPGVTRRAKNLGAIRKAVHGHVDYQPPGTENFPTRKDTIVRTPMSDDQRDVYDAVSNKANPDIARKIRSNFPLSRSEGGNLNAFLTGPRIASTTTRPYGGQSVTPKLQKVLENIERGSRDDPNYKSIAHSSYLEGGLDDLSNLLNERKISHGVFKGGLTDKERAKLVDDYNEGRIKHLLLSDAGAEGLDLKGTKAVHLLTPQWNTPRESQVTGRAIRFGSHAHLPEDQRHVNVYHYRSVMPKKWHQKLLGRDADTGVDDYLASVAQRKEALNDQFLEVLRQEGSLPT